MVMRFALLAPWLTWPRMQFLFRILIRDLPLRHTIMKMCGNEIVVFEDIFEREDFLAALDHGVFRQDAVSLDGKTARAYSPFNDLLTPI